MKVTRVLIAFDRADAGVRGASDIAERLMKAGIDCFRILFPKGMDANSYALSVTPASRSLGLLIRKYADLGQVGGELYEGDWVNVGTYRVMIHDKNKLGFYISPGKHGRIMRDKYEKRGEPMPCAVVLGCACRVLHVGAGG